MASGTMKAKNGVFHVSSTSTPISYGDTFTCPSDGYVRAIALNNDDYDVLIDGVYVRNVKANTGQLPTFVRKGMVVTITKNLSQNVRFFPITEVGGVISAILSSIVWLTGAWHESRHNENYDACIEDVFNDSNNGSNRKYRNWTRRRFDFVNLCRRIYHNSVSITRTVVYQSVIFFQFATRWKHGNILYVGSSLTESEVSLA